MAQVIFTIVQNQVNADGATYIIGGIWIKSMGFNGGKTTIC